MAYDLEEQEQLATLKATWNQYGNLVTWVLIAVLTAYAAWTGWNTYQSKQSAQASQLYEELQKSLLSGDDAKVQRAATDLRDKFSRTVYAAMSALSAARSAFDVGNLDIAKKQLQWVIDSSASEEYKAMAKIRLAGISLDEKNFDASLKLLSGDFPAEFQAEVLDRKGDIYIAQNKTADAKTAYQAAFEKMNDKSPARQLLQLKLDALGSTDAKANSK